MLPILPQLKYMDTKGKSTRLDGGLWCIGLILINSNVSSEANANIDLKLENPQMKTKSILAISLALLVVCGVVSPLYAKGYAQDTSQPMPELFKAIQKDDLDRARAAIESGGDVNGVYDRDTMLSWSLRNKNMEIAKLLLQSPRLDVNKRGVTYDDFGEWEHTPLILA